MMERYLHLNQTGFLSRWSKKKRTDVTVDLYNSVKSEKITYERNKDDLYRK
jgi:hypothetical protein